MKTIPILFACYLLGMTQPAMAAVYKCVGADGKVTYSNIPTEDCNQKQSVDIKNPETSEKNPDTEEKFTAELGKYRKVEVTKPKDQQTFYLNSGDLIVDVNTLPKLRKGHTIQVVVSGAEPSTPSRNRTITVSGVMVGPHTVVANIMDNKGKVVASSDPINIHIQKSTAVDNQDTKDLNADGTFKATGGSAGTTNATLSNNNAVGKSFNNNNTISTQTVNGKNVGKTANNPAGAVKATTGFRSNL